MKDAKEDQDVYDAVIIGSGFGGCMVAYQLIQAGWKVLMIERGDWVPRSPANWEPDGTLEATPFYSMETSYEWVGGRKKDPIGIYSCVGGPSVFYGGVSFRFREADFEGWPFSYSELEPYYALAERILGVAGETGEDPTEPFRSGPYPHRPGALSRTSQIMEEAMRSLGLHPFRLPLAINYGSRDEQPACIACTTCDTFACAVQAKNDLATRVLPSLIQKGLHLKTNTVATRLNREKDRIVSVQCCGKETKNVGEYRSNLFILSAGALAAPHLLLSSELQDLHPGGSVVGRYLMRHCSAFVYGIFPRRPNPRREFHKQLGVHDFYFGHPSIDDPPGKLGSIQQAHAPPLKLVHKFLPKPWGYGAALGVEHLTGLLVLAEDEPQRENGLSLDRRRTDRFGLPKASLTHRYSARDQRARKALVEQAKKILKKAGALICYVHEVGTFSHAVGSVRMGNDPQTSALDSYCRFRGIDNLFVVDGSFMPTSAGVNPSLTIAAQGLRVGEHLVHG